jgi:hypothetical protein
MKRQPPDPLVQYIWLGLLFGLLACAVYTVVVPI